MLKLIDCGGELHMIGGDGAVYLADVCRAGEELVKNYGGQARVVYLDPPFCTGGSFEFRRGKKQVAYTDSMPKEDYFELINSAAELAHKLLRDDGTLFIHVDSRAALECRGIFDRVFGEEAFTNEIIWAYKSGGRSKNAFSRKHDNILMYRKTPEAYFDIEAVGVKRGPERRNHMKRSVDEEGRVFYSIRTGGKEYRYYEDDMVYPSDVWDDIEHLHQRDPERTGFITQKPEALLKRIILACSEEGDLIIDLFGGSGTTACAAAKLGRRYVTVDKGGVATAVTRRRLVERCLKMRLYDSVSPMTVEREDPASFPVDLENYFTIREKDGQTTLTLKKLSTEETPYYVAVGNMKEGVFTAYDYFLRFKAGEKLTLSPGDCLHIVNEDMEDAFFINE
ncbi:MAG: site-specific DNA-methyltransferase [Clostridiales bacterium]|nr:site-specific DNA-methyltransferase [Clostridiales bacterium]